MKDYRAYIFDIDGHRFSRVEDFLNDHPDDAAALNAAKQLTDKHDVEVWDCGRLVARISPDGEVVPPELAPSLVFADCGKNSVKQAEPISPSKVSELASDVSPESNPFLR
jgi:hypothetical protein